MLLSHSQNVRGAVQKTNGTNGANGTDETPRSASAIRPSQWFSVWASSFAARKKNALKRQFWNAFQVVHDLVCVVESCVVLRRRFRECLFR